MTTTTAFYVYKTVTASRLNGTPFGRFATREEAEKAASELSRKHYVPFIVLDYRLK